MKTTRTASKSPRIPEIGKIVQSLQKAVTQLGDSARGAAATEPVDPAMDLVNSTAAGEICFEAIEPGPTATEVWLHNRGANNIGEVGLRCSDLLVARRRRDRSSPVFVSSRNGADARPLQPWRRPSNVEVADDVPPGSTAARCSPTATPMWLPVVLTLRRRRMTAPRTAPIWSPRSRTDCARWAETVRRSMLDAMPDGEPVQWLYGPMREYPSRPGKALAAGAVSVGGPGVRWQLR